MVHFTDRGPRPRDTNDGRHAYLRDTYLRGTYRRGTWARLLRSLFLILPAIVLSAAALAPAQAREFSSYAFVNEDASLRISRKHVRLYGIHVPDTGRSCRSNERPVRCASRAALALDFKIRGFVRCVQVARHRDRSITARCVNDGTDLGAYLIQQGWAVARPDAPFAYHTMERIARHRGMGVWGFPVDAVNGRSRY